MKKIWTCGIFFLFPLVATAQNNETTSAPAKIYGQCVLLPNALEPQMGPCKSLVLVLVDLSGQELQRTRTDDKGLFEFTPPAQQKGPFRITSGAKFYEPTKPKAVVRAGQSIELQLQQK